jgi:hypothetical protein
MGGALGLALLTSVASSRTHELRLTGDDAATALTGGYHTAFAVGALFAIAAAVVGAVLLRTRTSPATPLVPATATE